MQQNATTSEATVVVACKLPSGFIMKEFAPRAEQEQILGGGARDVTRYRPTGRSHVIGGTEVRVGEQRPILIGGFRLTRGVPKSIADNWFEANKTSDLVRNNLVRMHEKNDQVEGWAKEHQKAETGLEAIDPDAPGKRVRGVQKLDKKL